MKKIVLVGTILALLGVGIFATTQFRKNDIYYPDKVSDIPDGFMPLKDLSKVYPQLEYGFFETAIYFQKIAETIEENKNALDGKITVAQFVVKNSDFIVEFKKEYYFNPNLLESELQHKGYDLIAKD